MLIESIWNWASRSTVGLHVAHGRPGRVRPPEPLRGQGDPPGLSEGEPLSRSADDGGSRHVSEPSDTSDSARSLGPLSAQCIQHVAGTQPSRLLQA